MENLSEKKILVVGAGPVGLAAALFLSHKGIKPVIVEKLIEPNKNSKALGINPRTLELMDHIGAVPELIKNSFKVDRVNFYLNNSLLLCNDLHGIKHKFPFMIVQPQFISEIALVNLLDKRGVKVERGILVRNISNSNKSVTCDFEYLDGSTQSLTFDYIFCADGAHSSTRKSLGLKFSGRSFDESWSLFDVKLKSELNPNDLNIFFNKTDFVFILRTRASIWRVISNNSSILSKLPGRNEVEDVIWRSDFTISHRLIEKFSVGNVFFGGDAAHVHSPAGGRGMNLGIEDAFVFTELLALNKLDQFDKLRRKKVKKTITRVEFFTNIVRGKSIFYRFLRSLGFFILPYVFPLIKNNLNNFLFGLDHDIF